MRQRLPQFEQAACVTEIRPARRAVVRPSPDLGQELVERNPAHTNGAVRVDILVHQLARGVDDLLDRRSQVQQVATVEQLLTSILHQHPRRVSRLGVVLQETDGCGIALCGSRFGFRFLEEQHLTRLVHPWLVQNRARFNHRNDAHAGEQQTGAVLRRGILLERLGRSREGAAVSRRGLSFR